MLLDKNSLKWFFLFYDCSKFVRGHLEVVLVLINGEKKVGVVDNL